MTDHHLAPRQSDRFKGSFLALLFRWDTGPFLWSVMAGIGFYVVIMLTWAISRFYPLPALDETTKQYTVICCIGMAGYIITGLRIMQRNDEFMRALISKRATVAAFLTFGFLTIWGLFTNVGWAPQFPVMFAFGLFALVNVALIPFINSERP